MGEAMWLCTVQSGVGSKVCAVHFAYFTTHQNHPLTSPPTENGDQYDSNQKSVLFFVIFQDVVLVMKVSVRSEVHKDLPLYHVTHVNFLKP